MTGISVALSSSNNLAREKNLNVARWLSPKRGSNLLAIDSASSQLLELDRLVLAPLEHPVFFFARQGF